MPKYAAETSVPADRTRGEIERTLTRYGAKQFMYVYSEDRALVAFILNDRQIRFVLPMPDRESDEIKLTASRIKRSPTEQNNFYEKQVRQRWRALLLIIKGKLEAVDTGIVTFETEFLAHTVLPDGQTVAENIEPQIAKAYDTGLTPELLPALQRAIGR